MFGRVRARFLVGIALLCLFRPGTARLVTDFAYQTQCDHGQPTVVRWGDPGLACTFTALGDLPSLSSAPPIPMPWTVVTMYADVEDNNTVVLTMQANQGDTGSEPVSDKLVAGDTLCTAIPNVGPALAVSVCVTITDVALDDSGESTFITLSGAMNATSAGGVEAVLTRFAISTPEFIDCRLDLHSLTVITVTIVICLTLPFAIFLWCPVAVSYRTGRREAFLMVPTLRTRIKAAAMKVWNSLGDSNMWGAFLYLAASAMYIHARVNPSYLNAHALYRHVLFIVAASLNLHSTTCYHIAWEGSPTHPAAVDLWESYLNILGACGFVASSIMYLWSDYSDFRRPTPAVEFVFYILWVFEEVANCVSSYRWWILNKVHVLINQMDWRQFVDMVLQGLKSYTAWANVLSFIGSALYIGAAIRLMFHSVPTNIYYNSSDFIEQWEGVTQSSPPYKTVMAQPNMSVVQGIADFIYFIDAVLFLWVSWANFDIQVANEPMPEMPIPSDVDPFEEEYVPDTIDHDNTNDASNDHDEGELEDDIISLTSTHKLATIQDGVLVSDENLSVSVDGSTNALPGVPPPVKARVTAAPKFLVTTPPVRARRRYSIRRECCKHLLWPCWWAYRKRLIRRILRAMRAADEEPTKLQM